MGSGWPCVRERVFGQRNVCTSFSGRSLTSAYNHLLGPPDVFFDALAGLVNNKNCSVKTLVMVKVKERIVDIEEMLNRLEPEQKETMQNLRGLIKSAVPETVEIIKHGKITYKLDGKDFVWISGYRSHVNLDFSMGASLDSDLLKSGGMEKSKNVRFVTVSDFEKFKAEITRLLKEAAFLGFKHCSAAR